MTACAKKVPPPAPTPPPPPPAAPAPPPAPPPPPPRAAAAPPSAPGALSEEEVFARKSLDQLNAEHPLDDVYFDLDESEIRADGRSRAAEGRGLAEASGRARVLAIEGHCDSRGSAEYNLGLGSRRATAVKDYLVSLGVPAAA